MKKRRAWAAHGEGELGEVTLPGAVDDPEGHPVDLERVGGLERSHDEGHQVGGHDHGRGEPDLLLPARLGGLGHHRPVGVGGGRLVDHQGDLEGGLELGLVPAGEGPPGVGGLHLGGGDDLLDAVVVDEGGPVEAVQLVVEDAGEGQMQGGPTRGQRLGEGEGGPFLGVVEVDRGGGEGVPLVRVGVVELGEGDLELGGVEDDRWRWARRWSRRSPRHR